jgi:hypothetical protein
LRQPIDGLHSPADGVIDPVDEPFDRSNGLANPIDGVRDPVVALSNPIDGLVDASTAAGRPSMPFPTPSMTSASPSPGRRGHPTKKPPGGGFRSSVIWIEKSMFCHCITPLHSMCKKPGVCRAVLAPPRSVLAVN